VAQLTRLGIGGVGRTYGTITDKAEGAAPSIPAEILTRIAVGGVGLTYDVTDKAEDVGGGARPGDIFTRIGVGGAGIHYEITAKGETAIEVDLHTPGYYGTGIIQRRDKEEDEIIALIMAMYETGTLH